MGRPIIVVAPQDLPGGYPIPVEVNGETITITVPEGGVQEGDEICRFDDDDEPEAVLSPTTSTDTEESNPSKGAWRTHLCGCCDVITQATFWMACCLPPVLIAQLLNRLNLNYQGKPDESSETKMAYNKILLSFIFCLVLGLFFPGFSLFIVFLYLLVLYLTSVRNMRKYMRNKYQIPSKIDDGVCTLCCSCCVLVQMARHTHDDKEYPGFCCTTNGLDVEAPPIDQKGE